MLLDSQQKLVEKKLQELSQSLQNQAAQNFFQKLIAPKTQPKSLYIHGGVGRGKTMLMKNFFNSLPKIPKIYFHFNSFMRLIHEALRDIRLEEKKLEEKKFSDQLIESVKRVVQKNKVICFDEFQVLDIADAMLLSRIFTFLFEQKILVVFTSNCQPQQLYKNGLQREVFLQFVENILLKNCQVLHLNSPTDYRVQNAQNLSERYFISNQANRQKIAQIIENLVGAQKPQTTKIKVWGREIKIKKTFEVQAQNPDPVMRRGDNSPVFSDNPTAFSDNSRIFVTPSHDGVCLANNYAPSNPNSTTQTKPATTKKIAIFTFKQLCQNNFAAADYQAICQKFDLIFLLTLPKLCSEDENQAKRLMFFIDEIYENKTALVILAKTKPEQIYQNSIGCEAFKRTISRLNEIKSDKFRVNSKFA